MNSQVKDLIISLFPFLYRRKHFSVIDRCDLINYGSLHQEAELLLLRFLLKKKDEFIDVGCNRGAYVYQALKFIRPERIHAFEPNPELNRKLKAVFAGVNVHHEALSSVKGRSRLTIPFTNGHADDSLASIQEKERSETAAVYEVETNLLDNFFDKFKRVALVKIDVEGFEMEVLAGASRLISSHQPVLIVEIEQRHHKNDVRKLIADFCSEFNYTCCYFDPDKKNVSLFHVDQPLSQDLADLGTARYVNNFVFLPGSGDHAKSIEQLYSEIDRAKK